MERCDLTVWKARCRPWTCAGFAAAEDGPAAAMLELSRGVGARRHTAKFSGSARTRSQELRQRTRIDRKLAHPSRCLPSEYFWPSESFPRSCAARDVTKELS